MLLFFVATSCSFTALGKNSENINQHYIPITTCENSEWYYYAILN